MSKSIVPVLRPDNGALYNNEYTMKRGTFVTCCITVGNISIHIVRRGRGVIKVSSYPLGREGDHPLNSFLTNNKRKRVK